MSISFSEDAQQEVVTSSRVLPEDSGEGSLRPRLLKDYTGQEKAKENLQVCIDAARLRGEPLDHVLLYGPPGLGKTTMAAVIANEMGVNMRITSGPAIEKAGDLAALLTNLQENDILFVDEIHRLNRAVEEILYPAMEDYAIDIIIGKGPSANSIRLDLPHFTLIGATTRAGQLTAPLRDRFGVNLRLELYSPEELAEDRGAQRWNPQGGNRQRRCIRDRLALTRHAAYRQPPAQARARLCAGACRRRHHEGSCQRRAAAPRSGRDGPRCDGPAHAAQHHRVLSAADRSAWRRLLPRSARRP